jgi:integrase
LFERQRAPQAGERLVAGPGLAGSQSRVHLTIGTPLERRNMNRTVMEILGHSTIRLTTDTYTHVLSERLQAAADAMDRVMGRQHAG